jgi:hypothetical protein
MGAQLPPLLDPGAPLPSGPGEAGRYQFEGEGQLAADGQASPARLRDFNPYAWQPARVELAGQAFRLHTHDLRHEGEGLRLRGLLEALGPEPLPGGARQAEVVLRLERGQLTIEPEQGRAWRLTFSGPPQPAPPAADTPLAGRSSGSG